MKLYDAPGACSLAVHTAWRGQHASRAEGLLQ